MGSLDLYRYTPISCLTIWFVTSGRQRSPAQPILFFACCCCFRPFSFL
ncbi:unnamed protein product, partial [Musa hybrid cultivar]